MEESWSIGEGEPEEKLYVQLGKERMEDAFWRGKRG